KSLDFLAQFCGQQCIIWLVLPPRFAASDPSYDLDFEDLYLEIILGFTAAGFHCRRSDVWHLAGRADRFTSRCVRRHRRSWGSASARAADLVRPNAYRRSEHERRLHSDAARRSAIVLAFGQRIFDHSSRELTRLLVSEDRHHLCPAGDGRSQWSGGGSALSAVVDRQPTYGSSE